MSTEDGILAWAERLDELLERARCAAENEGSIDRIRQELRAYIQESPPYADPLDTKADLAILSLNLSQTEAVVTALQQNRADLRRLIKMLKAVAEDADSSVAAIRLTRFRSAVSAADELVTQISDLRISIADHAMSSDASLDPLLSKAIETILKLRNKLATLDVRMPSPEQPSSE